MILEAQVEKRLAPEYSATTSLLCISVEVFTFNSW
jgi:hypothetical protein